MANIEKSNEKGVKKGRGRPSKTAEDKESGLELTRKLVEEVHAIFPQENGRAASSQTVLAELQQHVKISDCLWSKYKCSLDVMGPERMYQVASFAYIHGARGAAVQKVLLSPRHDRHPKHNLDGMNAQESSLAKIADAIKDWLWMEDPLELVPDNFGESFERIVKLAKDMAWQEYLNGHNERLRNQDRALEALGFYDDPDGYVAREEEIIRQHEEESKNYFHIGIGANIDGGAMIRVEKPEWAKNKKT